MNQYVFAAASLPIMDSQPTFKGHWMDPMRRAVLVLLLMVGVGIGGRHAVLADSYDFTVIDVPESSYTGAYGINDRGEIVGASYTDAYDSPGLHGFLLSQDAFTRIDGPACSVPYSPDPQTLVYGINNLSQAVGVSNPCGSESHGFLWVDGILTTFDIPGSPITEFHGINDRGQIVGYNSDAGGIPHGFLLSEGTVTELIDPNSADVPIPFGINNRGDIVGSQGTHGFLLSGGRFTSIEVPGSRFTDVRGINDRGQIVGFYLSVASQYHLFLYKDGKFTLIPLPEGSSPMAGGINNEGEIVGSYSDTRMNTHGFKLTPKENSATQ